jgi:inhibitor of KinA sporulation pathway (predicted exonuclease)
MRYISIDLENEQPSTNHQCPDSLLSEEKIIQLGYTIFEDTGETIKDGLFNINIGVPISQYIQKLTGITNDDIAAGTTIDIAYDTMYNDCVEHSASRILLQWGGGDDVTLRKEITSQWRFGRSALNVKHLYRVFAEANGINPSGGLKKSMARVGLQFEGTAHNALTDAKNTARIFLRLRNQMKRNLNGNN